VNSVKQLLLKDPDSVKYRSKDGRSALHWAYEYNHIDLVELLKAAGADENALDLQGHRPIDMLDKDEL
jgi:ankyrin repeat protein